MGSSAPPYSIVARRVKEFKLGKTSTEDEHRERRPSTPSTEDNVKKVEDVVLTDRRVTIGHVAEVTGSSCGSVHRILVNQFNMKNVNQRTKEKTSRHVESESPSKQMNNFFWHVS